MEETLSDREGPLRSGMRWLERLSLDAVGVAVVWGLALEQYSNQSMDPWSILVLALATWLTYVADRLWDVRPGRPEPATDRHRYYKSNYKRFIIAWVAVFLLAVGLADFDLPHWKRVGGWVIAAGVVLYLFLLGRRLNPSLRLLFKRLLVPLIFTAGVGWMSGGWQTSGGLLALGVLFFGALENVLLISFWERRAADRPGWLKPVIWVAVAGLAVLGILSHELWLSLAGLFCAVSYSLLYWKVEVIPRLPVRALADGILFLAGAILLVS